ncbi:hypothetical protein BDZ94DRAFT_1228357 [Collybia nuda]|uniref:Uncharacterized protein n=1 Tax=Collybia nuda TaxID=64659 RepID=A0A9P5XT99_9AGAR|nr:hypothetical protein BDZ94DRAFT_1228357 [Collybia nuda]
MACVDSGHLFIAASILFFSIATYAVLFSPFLPSSGIILLNALANDTHYKYLIVFVIPVGLYFVIANWVGWQYYRNS